MTQLLSDGDVIERIFHHIDHKTTDIGEIIWREPTENYHSTERFEAEIELLRRLPVPFCPSAALPENGSYVARTAAGTPLLVVRGDDGVVGAFRNACRHRGMAVAKDSGCARAFVCPYHSWTYGLDGRLKHVPGADGFPGLKTEQHGLIPVTAEERGGLVLVTQDDPVSNGALDELPDIFDPEQQVFDATTFNDAANWKLLGETSMEGYHIKGLHNRTFFPYGYDNLNVIETFGVNSRITFPFRRVEKLRDIPPEKRSLNGMVTDVIQLFPNTHVSVLSSHALMIILEPISPSETQWVIYRLSSWGRDGKVAELEVAKRDAEFVKDTGLDEDREAARSIQAGLAGNANSHFTFGKYEPAIVHFHTNMDAHLAKLA